MKTKRKKSRKSNSNSNSNSSSNSSTSSSSNNSNNSSSKSKTQRRPRISRAQQAAQNRRHMMGRRNASPMRQITIKMTHSLKNNNNRRGNVRSVIYGQATRSKKENRRRIARNFLRKTKFN